jgi:hypothetical protein
MEAPGPEPQIDARLVRFELVAVAVLILGGFVFHQVVVVPVLAVLLAVSLGFGRRANVFGQVFEAVVEGRLGPATATEPAASVRFSELFAVAALSLATLLFIVGVGWLGWPVALIEAGISALHATTGISVEAAIRDRVLRRGDRR